MKGGRLFLSCAQTVETSECRLDVDVDYYRRIRRRHRRIAVKRWSESIN